MKESSVSFETPRPPALSQADRRELSRLANVSLRACVEGRGRPRVELPTMGVLSQPHGVFVTLRGCDEPRGHGNDELRGCMGTALPDVSLARGVLEYTRAAATRDPRFSPVSADELPRVRLEISVLSRLVELPGEPSAAVLEILEPGTHGVYLTAGQRRGLLLPQVAARLDLSGEDFLRSLARKAGIAPEGWRSPGSRLSVFTVESFQASRGE